MLTFKNLLFGGVLSLFSSLLLAQSPKKYCEAAEKLEKGQNYEGAIENYSKAIEMDPQFEKAYIARAKCYEKTNSKMEAVNDYKKLIVFDPKEKEFYYNAGRLLASIGNDKEADELLKKAIERDKGYAEAIQEEVAVLIRLKDYVNGVKMTQLAVDEKKSASTLYMHAVMNDSLKNYAEAERF